MNLRRLRWAIPPVVLILLIAFFALRPSREQQTAARFEQDCVHLEEIAQQVLYAGTALNVEVPAGWNSVDLYDQGIYTVAFSMGASGFGSQTVYWGVNYVPSDSMVGFQGQRWDYWRIQGDGRLYYDPEGDNQCYVKKLDDCWYYYEMSF